MGWPSGLVVPGAGFPAVLFLACVPLTAIWGYSLAHCLWCALRRSGLAAGGSTDSSPLPRGDVAWALLILLSGWFGALAYLAVVLTSGVGTARRQAAVAGGQEGRSDRHCRLRDSGE